VTLAGSDYALVGQDGSIAKIKGASIVALDENGRFPA
jgi:hypothetical protein